MSPNDRDSGEQPGDQPLEEIPLSLGALLGLLASERRRALLEFLWSQPANEGSFEAATREIITKIGRKQGYQPNHNDIQYSLHHHHIPKLEDAGVIEYDSQRQLIHYHEHERLETVYDQVAEFEID